MDGTIPEVPLVADAGNCLTGGAIPGQQVGHLDLWMDSLPITYIETLTGYGGGKGINMMRITAMILRIAATDVEQDCFRWNLPRCKGQVMQIFLGRAPFSKQLAAQSPVLGNRTHYRESASAILIAHIV